jgi:predicted anti-sigma-YlaC factor YlaD
MRQASCPREKVVLRAVRSGLWEEGLSAHLAKCTDCREIAEASQWMQALAQGSQKPTLPDASALWWSAQLFERRANAEKSQDILDWVELISVTVIAAGLAMWVGWNWNAIQSALASLVTEPWPQPWTDTVSLVSSTPTMFSWSALILTAVAIALGYPWPVRD